MSGAVVVTTVAPKAQAEAYFVLQARSQGSTSFNVTAANATASAGFFLTSTQLPAGRINVTAANAKAIATFTLTAGNVQGPPPTLIQVQAANAKAYANFTFDRSGNALIINAQSASARADLMPIDLAFGVDAFYGDVLADARVFASFALDADPGASDFDYGLIIDIPSVLTTTGSTDSGTLTEAVAFTQQWGDQDNFALTESASLNTSSTVVDKTDSDSATATDAVSMVNATFKNDSDPATDFANTESLDVGLAAVESATVSDTVSATRVEQRADSDLFIWRGEVEDLATSTAVSVSDVLSLRPEIEAVTQPNSVVDGGTLTESASVSLGGPVALTGSDSGHMTESASVVLGDWAWSFADAFGMTEHQTIHGTATPDLYTVMRVPERQVYQSVCDYLRVSLNDFNWFGSAPPFGATHGVKLVEEIPANSGEPIEQNTIAINTGVEDDEVPEELGAASGGVWSQTFTYFIDVYGENQGIARSISSDIAGILRGRFPGTGRIIPVNDYTGDFPVVALGHTCEFEDVQVETPTNQPSRMHWRVVKVTAKHHYNMVEYGVNA